MYYSDLLQEMKELEGSGRDKEAAHEEADRLLVLALRRCSRDTRFGGAVGKLIKSWGRVEKRYA